MFSGAWLVSSPAPLNELLNGIGGPTLPQHHLFEVSSIRTPPKPKEFFETIVMPTMKCWDRQLDDDR